MASGGRREFAVGVKLLFFGVCSQWLDRKNLDVDIPERATVLNIVERLPALERIRENRGSLQVAVNLEYAGFDTEVTDGDEVAFLPPNSGG